MNGTVILLSERMTALEKALRALVDFNEVQSHGESCEAHTEEYCTTDCPDPFTVEHALDGCSCTYGDVLRAKQLLGG
jgi:hypothetical protein